MPSLNFTVFIDKIESGFKTQTIRSKRKVPIQDGDTLYLYTGMRQKGCRKLGERKCLRASEIEIDSDNLSVRINGRELAPFEIKAVAKCDGFETVHDFFAFFARPDSLFIGQLIEWN